MTKIKTQLITTDNGQYTVYINEVASNRPYTILLHGGPGLNNYVERKELGPLLHKELNFIWFDQLGCSESKVLSPEKLNYENQINDIVTIIKKVTDQPINIIGHCFGAQVTHDIIRKNRNLVKNIVWYSPVVSVQQIFKRLLERSVAESLLSLSELTPEELINYNNFLKTKNEDFSGKEVLILLQIFPKIKDFQHLYWNNKVIMEKYLLHMNDHPMAFDVFIKMTTDYFERGNLPVPSYEGIPVLILYSDNDGITPWDSNGKKLLELIPHAKTMMIPNGYHWIQFEQATLCTESTINFLNS